MRVRQVILCTDRDVFVLILRVAGGNDEGRSYARS
jgi:hypothetical protein